MVQAEPAATPWISLSFDSWTVVRSIGISGCLHTLAILGSFSVCAQQRSLALGSERSIHHDVL